MRRFASVLLVSLSLGAHAFDEKAALKESQAAIGRQVGHYSFVSSEGKPVSLAELRGKPLVVHFIYTGCFQVCPASTQFLAQAVREAERTLGRGSFRVASIGFNQPADSPQAMKDFARKFGLASPDWLFLAPDMKAVPRLAAELGFRYEPTAAGFDHLLQATIIDASGRIYRQVYGDSFDAPLFTGPLLQLLQNAPVPQGSVAAAWEKVKLLCTVYDPTYGRYRLNYAVVIQILVGASVVLAVLASLVLEWRRRRRMLIHVKPRA
jgi:protein SCO1/2